MCDAAEMEKQMELQALESSDVRNHNHSNHGVGGQNHYHGTSHHSRRGSRERNGKPDNRFHREVGGKAMLGGNDKIRIAHSHAKLPTWLSVGIVVTHSNHNLL